MSTAACSFCSGARPAADHRIADLGVTVAYLHDDQFFPGWVVLALKRHATELFECLGNQIAHVHWHVIPRLPDDPAPRDAVWTVQHAPVRLAPVDRDARIAALHARLAP